VHQPVHSSVVWTWLSSRLSRSADARVDDDDSDWSRAMAVKLLTLSLSNPETERAEACRSVKFNKLAGGARTRAPRPWWVGEIEIYRNNKSLFE
jgi:hypothetical protein